MTNKDIDMIQENIRRDSFKNEYWGLYQEVWNFHKKYSKVQTDDAYWEAVVDESGQIAKKYDNHKFAIALLLAVIDELERIYKEMMKNADTAV